jgi:hypothetical protein
MLEHISSSIRVDRPQGVRSYEWSGFSAKRVDYPGYYHEMYVQHMYWFCTEPRQYGEA